MKKILYVSNIEVPYRVRMFNELSKLCDLTVLYERRKAEIRNTEWTESEKNNYKTVYLDGIKIKSENSFSFKIISFLFKGYDEVIIGCCNSPVQILMILLLKLFKKNYILNLDGEIFAKKNSFKTYLKKFFIKGADKYLVAGEKSGESLCNLIGKKEVIPYYFSSLSNEELQDNSKALCDRKKYVLVVGQYLDVKGMDVALDVARMDRTIKYKFIGMGNRTDLFREKFCPNPEENVEFIPFLQKKELEKEYRECSVFVLPSRQECWGLVVNEAASFGTPIVSTWGSGAAIEFLSDKYSEYLAVPGDSESLYRCIKKLISSDNSEYSNYLLEKSKKYSIENGVKAHAYACEL